MSQDGATVLQKARHVQSIRTDHYVRDHAKTDANERIGIRVATVIGVQQRRGGANYRSLS